MRSGRSRHISAETPTNTNTADQHSASLNVKVADQAHLAEAIDAANTIAKALAEISDLLDKAPAGATFTWDGQQFTREGLRAELDKTQFVVDDAASYSNGGVGTSVRGTGGAPNVDTLNFHAFSSANPNGYAAATYHGQGVAAMMLHELGHMTQQGLNETLIDQKTYTRDYGSSAHSYVGSVYWQNNENFAHDFEVKAVAMLGLGVGLYEGAVSAAHSYGAWSSALDIYNSHHPGQAIVAHNEIV